MGFWGFGEQLVQKCQCLPFSYVLLMKHESGTTKKVCELLKLLHNETSIERSGKRNEGLKNNFMQKNFFDCSTLCLIIIHFGLRIQGCFSPSQKFPPINTFKAIIKLRSGLTFLLLYLFKSSSLADDSDLGTETNSTHIEFCLGICQMIKRLWPMYIQSKMTFVHILKRHKTNFKF